MISGYLSMMAATIPSAIGNHLWQSTVFAALAALLTLTLRNYHARARYWVWFAASLKFVVPFALLVGMGTHLAWPQASPRTTTALYVAVTHVSQPFAASIVPAVSAGSHPSIFANFTHLLPAILAGVWFCGFLAIVLVRFTRWRRLSSAMREAAPIREGRELEILRRLERAFGMRNNINMQAARAPLEPGIFGIVQPVLFWPEGISEQLEDAHLEAIIAHELCHVRCCDNLAALVHMVVEATFWFHPLVWWLGARLVEERERACDEKVLELGADRRAYAESILRICEFFVNSPLACVSGVTGSDLKIRIARIMSDRGVFKLSFAKKMTVALIGTAAIVGPMVLGVLNPRLRAQSPRSSAGPLPRLGAEPSQITGGSLPFKVASVQPSPPANVGMAVRFAPGRLTLANWTTKELITFAYGTTHIVGGPAWSDTERYIIDVKVDDSLAYESGKLVGFNSAGRFPPGLRYREFISMLQSLLADRFGLKLSHQTKELPVYNLVIANSGLKIHEATPGDTYANGIIGADGLLKGPHTGSGQNGHLTVQALPMSTVAETLSQQLSCTVVDRTGLTGDYDFTLEWTPGVKSDQQGGANSSPQECSAPSIFTAIEQQLGLKLELQDIPTDFLVIDQARKP